LRKVAEADRHEPRPLLLRAGRGEPGEQVLIPVSQPALDDVVHARAERDGALAGFRLVARDGEPIAVCALLHVGAPARAQGGEPGARDERQVLLLKRENFELAGTSSVESACATGTETSVLNLGSPEVQRKEGEQRTYSPRIGALQCRGLTKNVAIIGDSCPATRAGERFVWEALAEGVGFEPTIRLPVYTLSKRAPSATRPSLRTERCKTPG
jgi:hypothetical protein